MTNLSNSPYLPGEAFHEAIRLVEKGEIEKARSLYPLMFKSDGDVVERRIAEAEAKRQARV